MDEWIMKTWYLHAKAFYSVIKKKFNTCDNMGGPSLMLKEISQTETNTM